MATGDLQPIYCVRAEAVPLLICAYELGEGDYRVKFARGIGWAPTRYTSRAEVLDALLKMRSYTAAEARSVKAICKPTP